MNVLVVDDEPIIRTGLRSFVDWEHIGFTLIAEAEDGEEAWELLKRLPIDIVITDLLMPRMDGLELIRRIKEAGDDVGVIVLSCMDDFAYVKEAMKHGAKDYILKPTMEPEQLVPLLGTVREELLRQRGTRKQLAEWQGHYEQARQQQLSGRLEAAAKSGVFSEELEEELFADGVTIYITQVYASPSALAFQDDLRSSIAGGWEAELQLAADCKAYVFKHRPDGPTSDTGWFSRTFGPLTDIASIVATIELMSKQNEAWFYGMAEPLNGMASDVALPYEARADVLRAIASHNQEASLHRLRDLADRLRSARPPKDKARAFLQELLVIALSHAREKAPDIAEELELAPLGPEWVTLEQLQASVQASVERLIDLQQGAEGGKAEAVRNPFISKALQFMREHYGDNIGTVDIAEHVRLSRSYFSDLYSKETGESLIETLTRIRIQEAKRRLRSGEMKVYEVAEAVGFADAKIFAKTFKRLVGCTPKEFEAQNK